MSKATSPVAFTPRGVNKNSFDALKMYLTDMSDDEEGPDNDGEEDDCSGILVTESIVLEATGEESCTNVTQLILRDRRVSAFDPECASQLCALSSLSLSHNRIATLNPEHFGGGNNLFAGLRELNLNFNQLTSAGLLGGLLVAPHLTKLFLSSNRLDDSLFGHASSSSTVGFARRFPKLSSLCLFKNALADLGLCLAELAQLPKLKELDLDGNPFCEEVAAPVTVPTTARTMGDGGGVSAGWYRHTVVRSLGPRLSLLDGEPVGALDRNLAAAFFNQHQEQAAAAAAATAGASSSASIIPSPRIGFGGGRGGAGGEEAGGGFAAGVGSSFDWSDLPSDSDDDSDGDDCDQEDVGSGGGYGGGYGVGGGGGCSGRRSSTTTATNKNSAKSSHVLLGYLATDALGLTPRMQSPPSPSSTDSAPHSFPTHGDNAAAAGDDSAYDGGGGGTPAGVAKHQRTSSEGSGGGVGIVPPLRLALPNGGGITGGVQTGGDITPLLTARSKYAKQVKESLPVLSARSGSGGSSGGGGLVDLGDPFAVIRRLVKMVELLKDEKQAQEEWRGEGTGLQEEDADDDDGHGSSGDDEDGDGDGGKRKQCRGKAAASTGAPPSTGGGMGVVAALQRDITELRIENANMFLLKEENRVLRAKAAKVDAAELKAASLEKECAELRADLGQASTQLQAMHLQQAMSTAPTTPSSSSSSSSLHSFAFPNSNGGGGVGSGLPPRRTSATLTQPTSSQQQQQQLLLRHRPGMLQQGAAASALSLHHPHDQEEGGSSSSSSLLPPLLQAPANLPSVSSLTSTSAPLKVAAASVGNPSQQAQHPASAFTDPWACSPRHIPVQTSSGRPMTAAQVLEECEDELDQEVLQLLAANEQGLKQVRHDLKKVKKEVEREGRQKQQQDGKPSGGASKGSADGASAFTSGSSSSRRQRPDNTGSLSPPSSISRQAKKAPTPRTSSSLAELLSMRRNGGSATPRPSSSSSSSSPRPETNSNSNSLRSLATSSAKAAADGGADVWTANDDDDDDEEEVDLGADQAEDSDGGGGSLPTNVSSSHALLRRSNASTAETIAAAMVVPPLVLSKTTPYRGSSGGGGGGDDGLGAELVAPSCCPSPRPPRAYSTQIKTSTATSRAAGGGDGSGSRSTVKAAAVAPSFVVPPGRMPTTAAAASAGPREDGAAASEARSAATLSRRGGGGDSKTKGSKSERIGKVAPRSNGTFGDVITVHSPRQAALIFDLLN